MDIDQFEAVPGVFTVAAGGDIYDPYFAGKAILCAEQLGLSVQDLCLRYLQWLLPRQEPDGRFARYCRSQGWQACDDADADDALCAIVIELILIAARVHGFRADWRRALERCLALLARLKTNRGTYNISMKVPVQLLMDNCEIYSAYARLSSFNHPAIGRDQIASARRQKAHLGDAIVRQFWRANTGDFLVTSQLRPSIDFYPDAVAQLFPRSHGLNQPIGAPAVSFKRWFAQYGERWLSGKADHYPWGLLAMAARADGREEVVRRWLAFAALLRNTDRWNVLEDAIFQGLSLPPTRRSQPRASG